MTEVTADQAKDMLGLTTRHGVIWLIHAGHLPGARKLDPMKTGSPWLIPIASVEAYKKKKKRAQSGD